MGGARGVAGSESEEEENKAEENEKKGKGGLLSKLSNPFGSGKKEEWAEVTGSAAARGVETELGKEEPGNPSLVVVQVSAEDLRKFKHQGGLV